MSPSYMPVKEERDAKPLVSDEERIILELEKMPNRYGLAQWEIDVSDYTANVSSD